MIGHSWVSFVADLRAHIVVLWKCSIFNILAAAVLQYIYSICRSYRYRYLSVAKTFKKVKNQNVYKNRVLKTGRNIFEFMYHSFILWKRGSRTWKVRNRICSMFSTEFYIEICRCLPYFYTHTYPSQDITSASKSRWGKIRYFFQVLDEIVFIQKSEIQRKWNVIAASGK